MGHARGLTSFLQNRMEVPFGTYLDPVLQDHTLGRNISGNRAAAGSLFPPVLVTKPVPGTWMFFFVWICFSRPFAMVSRGPGDGCYFGGSLPTDMRRGTIISKIPRGNQVRRATWHQPAARSLSALHTPASGSSRSELAYELKPATLISARPKRTSENRLGGGSAMHMFAASVASGAS